MIPIELRKELNMSAGKEYQFYLLNENAHRFICIDCGPEITDEALAQAIKIVQESGMKIV